MAGAPLPTEQDIQLLAVLVRLHNDLGFYETYLRSTGYMDPGSGPGEDEALKTILIGIEKRADALPKTPIE